jgi:subtilisin family serine protease
MPLPASTAIRQITRPIHIILDKIIANSSANAFTDPQTQARLVQVIDGLLVAEAPQARLVPKRVRETLIARIVEDTFGGAAGAAAVGVAGLAPLASDLMRDPSLGLPEDEQLAELGLRGLTVKLASGVAESQGIATLRQKLGERIAIEPFPSLPGVLTVKLTGEDKPLASEAWEAARQLAATGQFEYAEPNFAIPAVADPEAPGLLSLGPGAWDRNHPSTAASFEWSLDRIHAKAIWSQSKGEGVVVGHIDTGYTLHPELKPNLDRNRDFDFWDGDADAQDPLKQSFLDRLRAFLVLNPGHGTGTGSVIVSPVGKQPTTRGQAWVSGTAPKATLIPYRATPSVVIVPGGSQDEVARAIVASADAGVDVISMSLGSPWDSALLRTAVEHALKAGVIVCAAAGNIVAEIVQGDRVTYPAKYAGVVAVAGCDFDYAPWSRSCRGLEVDITAPGTDVWRAVATNDLNNAVVERGSGTSFAVATVAGVAACWIGRHGGRQALRQHYGSPRLIPAAFLLSLTRHTKIPLASGDPLQFGGGVLDVNTLANLPLPSVQDVTASIPSLTPQIPTNLSSLEAIAPAEANPATIESLFQAATGMSPQTLTGDELKEFSTHLASQPFLLAKWWDALIALTQSTSGVAALQSTGASPVSHDSIGKTAAFGLSASLAGKIQATVGASETAAMELSSTPPPPPIAPATPSPSVPQPLKQVVVYTMHEYEQDEAVNNMSPTVAGKEQRTPVERTNSFVMGEATESEIAAMRQQGLFVEEVNKAPSLRLPQPPGLTPSALFAVEDLDVPQRFLLRLKGPMLESRRAQLETYHIKVMEALPGNYYRVETSPAHADDATVLDFVSEIFPEREVTSGEVQMSGPAGPRPFAAVKVFAAAPAAPGAALPQVPYDLWLKLGVDSAAIAALLTQNGHIVEGAAGRKVRVLLTPGSAEEQSIELMPEVEKMEPFVMPELHNDRSRRLIGLSPSGMPPTPFPWTGRGQIIAIADTGIDPNHPDFQGRLHTIVGLGRPGQTDDPHGHGTHVAGSALGDGAASAGTLAGTAPDAKLYFQSILGPATLTNPFPLSGLPVALSALFDPPYLAGARIHSNSWGAFATSFYRLSSREVDDFVHEHRDMLIVISAGNDGTTRAPLPPGQRRSGNGFVDWYSLGAPATSKNALTVGASQSDITVGGFASLTYNAVWPNKFPLGNVSGDIAAQTVSGAPNEIAGFSSRGPADSLQIKPDVVAPGTDIASAKSSLAPSHHFSGPYAGNALYAHMCGTSMAAPLVSGCAAAVREYFVAERAHQPSAALLKATLINGTDELGGAHSTAAPGGFPNGHQGFGRINMQMTLPHPQFVPFELFFHDNWQTPATHLTINDRQRFEFDLPAGQPWLRLCLTYTDLPGDSVQNKLLLLLHHVPSNTKHAGNDGQLAQLAPFLPSPDRKNDVSIIRLNSPPAGRYVIQVSPANMPFGGAQDFALVISAPTLGGVQTNPFNQ